MCVCTWDVEPYTAYSANWFTCPDNKLRGERISTENLLSFFIISIVFLVQFKGLSALYLCVGLSPPPPPPVCLFFLMLGLVNKDWLMFWKLTEVHLFLASPCSTNHHHMGAVQANKIYDLFYLFMLYRVLRNLISTLKLGNISHKFNTNYYTDTPNFTN